MSAIHNAALLVRVADLHTTNTRGISMSHFPRNILGAAIAAALAAPGISWAQPADATLRGKAPASTAITAKNVATGATRRTQSSAEGFYTLPGLPPGTY